MLKSSSQPNLYTRLSESESDSDINYVKVTGDTENLKVKKKTTFQIPLKIKEEKKIDLRQYERISAASDESLKKIFTIEEFEENTSRASSKMDTQLKMRQNEVHIKRNKTPTMKPRPVSRRDDYRPQTDQTSLYVIYQSSKTSIESCVPSELDCFDFKFDRSSSKISTSTKKSEDMSRKSSKKKILTENEIASFHKIANDFTMKKLSQSNFELSTKRSCNSTFSQKSISCFGKCSNLFMNFCAGKSLKAR